MERPKRLKEGEIISSSEELGRLVEKVIVHVLGLEGREKVP